MEETGVRLGGYGRGVLADGIDAGGIGSARGLASGIFLRLGAGGAIVLEGVPSASRARTRCLTTTLLTSSAESNLEEEGPDVCWDGDRTKAELAGGVSPSGRGIGGVKRTRDISRVKRSIAILR